MAEPTRKQMLLDDLNSSRAEWDALVAELLERKMAEKPVMGKWTLKDVAAHLTFWETRPVKWFEAAERGKEPDPSPLGKDLSEDDENEWIYQQNYRRSLDDVFTESREVHEALVKAVRAMPDQDLTERKHTWLGDNSLAAAMPGNTYEHYREHVNIIRAWLDQNRA